MNMSQYIQIIAIVIVFAIYIYGLFKVIKITRGSSPSKNKWNIVNGFTLTTLFLIYLILNTYAIEPKDFALIMLTFGLVLATTLYAISAAKQADASVKMAKQVVKPMLIPDFHLIGRFSADRYVRFEARVSNDGNGPAYDIKVEIQDDGAPPSILASGDIASILRGHNSVLWHAPDPRLSFPKSDKVQRRFFVIKYKDVDGEHEIHQPFVLTTGGRNKPIARLESISRSTLRKQNLEDELL